MLRSVTNSVHTPRGGRCPTMRAAVGVATLLLSAALLLLVWLRPVEVRQLVPTQIAAKREARARAGSLIDTAYPLADGGVLSSSASSTSSTGIVTSSISSISAMEGYCAVTEGAGDCERGSSGSWQRMATLEACAARCARCARCRFVSFSRALDDCSWYTSCTPPLLTRPHGFSTIRVPAGRPPILQPPPWRSASAPPHDGRASTQLPRGYCSMTVAAGDCLLGELGTIDGVRSLEQCRLRCMQCARCAVISWSHVNRDCSWYAACELSDLRRPPRDAPDYVSERMRSEPLPLPRPPTASSHPTPKRSLAIVTLAVPPPNNKPAATTSTAASSTSASSRAASASSPWDHVAVGCALLQWCERASLLGRAVRSTGWTASLLLLGARHNPNRRTCLACPNPPSLT